MSIGNISKDIRNQLKTHAWVPIAYLPVCKWADDDESIHTLLTARLFHQCLEAVLQPLERVAAEGKNMADSKGAIRRCYTRISVYICDQPEQCLNNCVMQNASANYEARGEDLGNDVRGERRTFDSLMSPMRQLRAKYGHGNIAACQRAAKRIGLSGVLYPWWERHAGYEPWLALAPDILHGLHRFWRDHVLEWVQWLIGKKELDQRLMALQHEIGLKHFHEGISKIQQWTCREDRELQRTLIALISGANRITPQIMQAIRALMDFIYITQYESHDDHTLLYLTEALAKFHEKKDHIMRSGARRGKHDVIEDWEIPKLYGLHLYADVIPEIGSPQQHSTEYGERRHITLAKDLFRATNRKNYGEQMCRALDRKERIRQFCSFLIWAREQIRREELRASMHGRSTHEQAIILKYIGEDHADYFPSEVTPEDSDDPEARPASPPPPHHLARPLCRLRDNPHTSNELVTALAARYNLPDLIPAIDTYLQSRKLPPASRHLLHDPDAHIPYHYAHSWVRLRYQAPKVHNGSQSAPPRTIEALPPSRDMPYGRCNCVLVHNSEEAEEVGIAGMY